MLFNLIEGDVVIKDTTGNPIGVVLDGEVYRLQVGAVLTDNDGVSVQVQQPANALRVEDAELHELLTEILCEMRKVTFALSEITGESL